VTAPVETQPERTALAWQRTGLGILAVAGLLGHGAVRDGEPGILVAAGVAALASLGVLGGLAPVRYRRLTRPRTPAAGASWPLAVRVVTGTVVLVALLAVAAIVTPR
jgi:putative membrane protein